MLRQKIAVVGVGATGTVLAAALLSRYPETVRAVRNPGVIDMLSAKGLRVSGVISYQAPA